jgi:predicted GH43/DUF377 family glycosyl hydrolase
MNATTLQQATLLLLLLTTQHLQTATAKTTYTVAAKRTTTHPVIDKQRTPGSSIFDFNYNPGYFNYNDSTYLMVRVQNKTNDPKTNSSLFPYGGPSLFAVSKVLSPTSVTPIQSSNVVFGNGIDDIEDPRIVFDDIEKIWYMYYTKSEAPNNTTCTGINPCARLSVAFCSTDPTSPQGWRDHGPLWPNSDVSNFQWTKSGAVLPSQDPTDLKNNPHLLIWSNWCTFTPWVSPLYVQLAYSYESLKGPWIILPSPLMDKRAPPAYDSYVLESGPPPVKIAKTGDWLFLYNGARQCQTSKPNYERCYAMGWLILDGNNPTIVLQRSKLSEPLLVPMLEWEIGNTTMGDQTPNAVFIDGALFPWSAELSEDENDKKNGLNVLSVSNGMEMEVEKFLAFYGGSDTAVGSMIVEVGVVVEDEFFEEEM